jgi:glycosyltransferase involved in cell wall biosynthesis
VKLAVIAGPFLEYGGASKRSARVLPLLAKHFDLTLLIPDIQIRSLRQDRLCPSGLDQLRLIQRAGVVVPESVFRELEAPPGDGAHSSDPFQVLRRERMRAKQYLPYLSGNRLVYSHHEAFHSVWLARELSRMGGFRVGVLLQLQPFFGNPLTELRTTGRGRAFSHPASFLGGVVRRRLTRGLYNQMLREGTLRFLTSISNSPLTLSGLDRRGVPVYVLEYPTSADPELTNFRTAKPDIPIAVFFARLTKAKGLGDLSRIWREVLRLTPNARLKIAGRFSDDREANAFMAELASMGVSSSVEYLGYLPETRLAAVVASAKCSIYPSHQDSFSLTVTESLTLGTPVVAYNIPALVEKYSGISAVRLVSEGNITDFAKETATLLTTSPSEIFSVMSSPDSTAFVAAHTSWERVADSERAVLSRFA